MSYVIGVERLEWRSYVGGEGGALCRKCPLRDQPFVGGVNKEGAPCSNVKTNVKKTLKIPPTAPIKCEKLSVKRLV